MQKNVKNKTKKKYLKMNCGPSVKKTIHKWSCYSNEMLFKLKKDYNEHHTDKIRSNTPLQIWKSLKNKINWCEKEDCWLNEIHDETLKKEICDTVFSPYSPKSWKNNPNEWLSNIDIRNVMQQYEKKYNDFLFLGPTPIDFDSKIHEECVERTICLLSIQEQLKRKINKIGIVFNLDKHNQSGSHWVSMFIDLKKHFIFYFDSAGEKIPNEIEILKNRIIEEANTLSMSFKYIDNEGIEHQKGGTECGMYSLYFLITMLNEQISLKKKIQIFTKQIIPDKYVEKYRKIYYNYI